MTLHGGVMSTTTEVWDMLCASRDPNKAGAAWSAPLGWAMKKGHSDVARDLMAAGAVSN